MLKDWKRKFIHVILSLVGILLLIYLIKSAKLENILHVISHAYLPPLIVSASLSFSRFFIGTCKWRFTAKDQGVDLGFLEMMKIYAFGVFLSSITPAALGGYLRAKFLYDHGKNLGRSVSNIIVDSTIEALSLHIPAMFLIFVFFPDKLPLTLGVFSLIFLSAFQIILIMKGEVGNRLADKILISYLPERYRNLVKKSMDKIFDKPPRFVSVVKSFFTSMVYMVCMTVLQIYLISRSLGLDIPFLDMSAIWMISLSISGLPVTVSGLGIREWSVAYLSSKYLVNKSVAISLSLLGYAVVTFIPAVVGGILFLVYHISHKSCRAV